MQFRERAIQHFEFFVMGRTDLATSLIAARLENGDIKGQLESKSVCVVGEGSAQKEQMFQAQETAQAKALGAGGMASCQGN